MGDSLVWTDQELVRGTGAKVAIFSHDVVIDRMRMTAEVRVYAVHWISCSPDLQQTPPARSWHARLGDPSFFRARLRVPLHGLPATPCTALRQSDPPAPASPADEAHKPIRDCQAGSRSRVRRLSCSSPRAFLPSLAEAHLRSLHMDDNRCMPRRDGQRVARWFSRGARPLAASLVDMRPPQRLDVTPARDGGCSAAATPVLPAVMRGGGGMGENPG
ncbi:hypothetical protein BT67DRAFT_8385 [Trichocladium antarcticum]|uniref:Uncharacterized protein n=1 Tax=Trichocladium antarcticum TaxID=1450529 RepID=A0AAN6UV45_9PEZI|nr:hypothetical protein BT67DRAFT_8385 [Trichocladium antarcticum]